MWGQEREASSAKLPLDRGQKLIYPLFFAYYYLEFGIMTVAIFMTSSLIEFTFPTLTEFSYAFLMLVFLPFIAIRLATALFISHNISCSSCNYSSNLRLAMIARSNSDPNALAGNPQIGRNTSTRLIF